MFELLFKYPQDLYARSELVYAGGWPSWLPGALIVIALAAIVGFLWQRRQTTPAWLLASTAVLQFAMVLLVIWVLSLPTLETEELREGENTIAVALDTSESMALGPGQTRLEDGRQLAEQAISAADELEFAVRRYEFDAAAREVDNYTNSEPTGSGTALGSALSRVLEEARQSPLAGVIVVSDGADTSGGLSTTALAELGSFGVPVYGAVVGRSEIPEDLELSSVTVPPRTLPDSTVTARVAVRHDGPVSARLRVFDMGELLASVPVELSGDASGSTIDVDLELTDAGPHELEFSLATDGDPEPRNNSRRRLVEVTEANYRALYFEGEPRWEYKFMRRALDGGTLSLETLLRVSPNKYYRQGIESPEDLADGFPTTRDELFSYDALIIGSVEAATLTPAQHALIRDFVAERGGSLLMLGGRNGLGNGGWAQTAVADALPVRLPGAESDSFRRIQAPVSLTPAGMDAQMLRFSADGEENLRLWSELPAVADYQFTGDSKPAAVTLANVDTDAGPSPLLVTQTFGRGHSYLLATGGTWRWQMSLPVEDERHEVFWRQLLRTLVAAAAAPTSLVATTTPGTGIELRAEFRDDSFAPIAGVTVSAAVANDDGDSVSVELDPSPGEPGVYTGRVDPGRSGTFYAEALAVRGEEVAASARASVVYESGQAEHFGIRSNRATLERIAAATGGAMLEADNLGVLPDLLRFSNAGITEIEARPIWDMPAAFLLLLLLKASEWLLRRRGGSI